MKLQLLLIMLLSSILLKAQPNVKVKKEIISLDNIEVGKIKSPYRNFWDFTDLNDKKLFSVKYAGASANSTETFTWLEIESSDKSEKAFIPYEVLVTAFNVDRIIAHLLIVKYNIYNNKGIDNIALDKLFKENTEDLSIKYGKIVSEAKAGEEIKNSEVQAIKTEYAPKVSNDGTISFTRPRNRIVGSVTTQQCNIANTKSPCIKLYDLNNSFIAAVYPSTSINTSTVETYKGEIFTFKSHTSPVTTPLPHAEMLLPELINKGYLFGYQQQAEAQRLHNTKVRQAINESENIYNQQGYVIDDKGNKIEGYISIAFQILDVNRTGNVLPATGPDNFGKTVYIKYINEKNKERIASFKARENVTFCIKKDGTEVCYEGMQVYGEAFKKLQNMDALNFDHAYFYQVLNKYEKITLLQDPVEKEKFVLKLPNEKKGQMIDNRSSEKLLKSVSDYLSACKTLSDEIKNNGFDLKLQSNLEKIAEEYNICK